MVLCIIVGCGNKSGKSSQKKDSAVKFSRVPKIVKNEGEMIEELTTRRRRAWISAISRGDLTDDKLEHERVCSRHFVSGQAAKQWDQFDVDWVPTLHLGHTKRPQRIDPQLNADRAERRKRRQEIIDREISEKMKKLNEPGETVESIFSEVEHTCTTREAEESDQLQDGSSEDEQMAELEMEMDVAGEKLVEDTDKKPILIDRDSQTLVSAMTQETADAATQTTEFDYLFCSATKTQPFTEDYFKDSDDKTRFYTGLPDFHLLAKTFEFVSPYVTRRTKTLSLFQEFVMVLIKLRLNVPNLDLAYRFEVSLSTVSRVFKAWMEVLDVRLSPLISWPEREELWRTMPRCFQYTFGKATTIIIDCFEIYIDRPSNLLARAQTYSHYKSHNTVKVLIGITPQGSVCFVSKAWGGRTSDKYLTEHCGMLKNLRPGDLVMADRGFTIEENLSLYQAKLAIPAFTKGKSQLDPVSVEKTRGIANVRIHVERVIGLLRQKYTVLQSILPIDYLLCSDKEGNRCCPMVDRLIRVCCALINLCPSVVPFD